MIKITKIKVLFVCSIMCIMVAALFLVGIPATRVSNSYKDDPIELPIIMYHHMSTSANKWNDYVISPKQFEKDLAYITQKGYTPITMTQLIQHFTSGEALPEKPIIITFDDGHESVYALGLPILEKYNACAVVSVVGSYVDNATAVQDHNITYSYLTWEELAAMSQSQYFEIQNHSYSMHMQTGRRSGTQKMYRESSDAYRAALNDDIGKNQSLIFEHTGISPNTFTYPFGFNSTESREILLEMGFSAALTCQEKVNTIRDASDLMKLGRFNRPHGTSSETFFKKILD